MGFGLDQLVDDIAKELRLLDSSGCSHKGFKPGIGPFGESNLVRLLARALGESKPKLYAKAAIKRHPDLLIPGEWELEFKIVRPFGNNGKEAENWSQNVLHPYAGNVSSLSDSLRLSERATSARKAVIVLGYEHNPAVITLDPCIVGFELLAGCLLKLNLGERLERRVEGLVHPVHQVLRLFAWEVR